MRNTMFKILAIAMVVLMFAGCSASTTAEQPADETPAVEAPTNEAPAEEASATETPKVDWPTKTVEIYMPFSPGGNSDIVGRVFAEALSEKTGANFVVVNQPEGGGAVCYNTIANAPADGSILGWVTPSWFTSYFSGTHDLNPAEAFTTLAKTDLLAPVYLVVAKDSPFETLEDLIEYCTANPGELIFGMALGTASQYYAESMARNMGISWNYVENGTDTERITSILGGITQATVVSSVTAQQYVEAGEVRALVAADDPGEYCAAALKDVPTLEQAGFANITVKNCNFLYGPIMDDALAAEINRVFTEMFYDPDVQDKLIEIGQVQILAKDNVEATQMVKELYENYREIAQALDILAEGR